MMNIGLTWIFSAKPNHELVSSLKPTVPDVPMMHFGVTQRSNRLVNYVLGGYFVLGLFLAHFHGTWLIAVGMGGFSLVAYHLVRLALSDSCQYQYVLSVVLGVFMAQFIYQTHGMFEMHFFAFIGSALLITYQNWKLQPVSKA